MGNHQFSYGGQAVIEGVMMRGRQQATIAVRQPTGMIAFKHIPLHARNRETWTRLPLLRGVLMLWDALRLGITALNFSASAAFGEAEEERSKSATIGTLVISLTLSIGLFFVLPLLLASLAGRLGASPLQREVLEGILRLIIIIVYIVSISRIPEIRRVFQYHGAEHKVVNAYEAGASLTAASVQKFSLIHPRCGTSFLALVVLISFIIFIFFGGVDFWARLLSRIVLVPLIAALAYEVLRLTAAHYHRLWVRVLIAPSLALQQLTTREPDDNMIAVAIAALLPVLTADGVSIQASLSQDEQALATLV